MAGVQLSEADIAHRLPVWTAFSDIFLDTECGPDRYRSIAQVIRHSGFTLAEAEAIFRDEVAPAFSTNLLSVAGEWQGWSDNFVKQRVLANRGSWLARAVSRAFHQQFVNDEWSNIAAQLLSMQD